MDETRKSHVLREQGGHYDRFLKGIGVDIGAGSDPLTIPSGKVYPFDMIHGDANFMDDYDDNQLDFVYSSHCLEHMVSVPVALYNWCRIIAPGGHLYFTVPDWEYYEKRRWPSKYNPDHKSSFSFTYTREDTGRTNHYHIEKDLIPILELNKMEVLVKELQLHDYDHSLPDNVDQTMGKAIIQILIVAQKLPASTRL